MITQGWCTHEIEARVEAYIARVNDGALTVGRLESLAVERYVRDRDQFHDVDGIHFAANLAARAAAFFPRLQLTTGEYYGKPFELADWELFCVWNLFGWQRGTVRRFREAFLSVARGNGKSPFGAGLIVLLTGFDSPREPRAECYTVATKLDQAKIVFNEARRIIEANPAQRARIATSSNRLTLPDDSTLCPLGSDSKNTDGLVIHGIVRDELHAWRQQHRGLYEKIETAMCKRRQPLAITITTAGSEESLIWKEQYDYSVSVVTGDIEGESQFVFICEIDDDDEPLDEAVWPKANPMLADGVVKIQHLRDMAAKAATRPDMREEFKRYHCNRLSTSTAQFITSQMYATGNETLPDFDGVTGYGGFDWGWADDLAAYAWVFPTGEQEVGGEWRPVYAVVVDVFIPRGTDRELSRDPWRTWIQDGLLTVTDSEHVDPYAIYRNAERRADEWDIKSIAFDRHNCDPLATRIQAELGIEMYPFPQTFAKYHAPTMELRNAFEEGRIIHGGNPLLGWCMMNMARKESPDGLYVMPSKKRSQDKIDPAVAVIMALSEAMYHQRSAYEMSGNLAL